MNTKDILALNQFIYEISSVIDNVMRYQLMFNRIRTILKRTNSPLTITNEYIFVGVTRFGVPEEKVKTVVNIKTLRESYIWFNPTNPEDEFDIYLEKLRISLL